MPSHHRGDCSKHPANVKIAILEFIEARMKDVVEYLFHLPENTYDSIDKDEEESKYTKYTLYRKGIEWFVPSLESFSSKPDFKSRSDFNTWLDDNISKFVGEGEENAKKAKYAEAFFRKIATYIDDVNTEVKVYDPFTTENDFYLILEYDYPDYLLIYGLYYKTNFIGPRQVIWENEYPDIIKNQVYGEDGIFNASTSKTEIFYTIQQMKNILECGKPDGCPESETFEET